MAKKSRMSVLKRQRERKKAEKAALKRERRGEPRKDGDLLIASEIERQREEESSRESQVATREDLAGYGFPSDTDSEEEDE